MFAEEKLINEIPVKLKLQQVYINKFNINYITCGEGYPLLLLHGANIGWGQWYPNLPPLSKHFQIYALDLPGSAGSTKFNYTSLQFNEDFVNTVMLFIHKIIGKSLNIVGHSVGGAIAVKVAISPNISVHKVVLLNSMGLTEYLPTLYKLISLRLFAQFLAKTVLRPSRQTMSQFLKSVLINKTSLSQVFLDYYYEGVMREKISHPLLFINALTEWFAIKKDLYIANDLKRIQKKVLILHGENDPLIPLDHLLPVVQNIPKANFSIFKNTGHVPSIERSTIFNERVLSFLLD